MLYTTFRKAKEAGACVQSYRKMARALGGITSYGSDTPIPLDKVLEVCGLNDTLWSLRAITKPADKEIRLFACDCAERILPNFEKGYPDDKRPRQTIEVSRRYALGQVTQKELADAAAAAAAAAYAADAAAAAAAYAADAAAYAAAYAADAAAYDAAYAADAAAYDAADAAAYAAAYAAADAAHAAADAAAHAAAHAAADAAAHAADAAEREWQKQRFLQLLAEPE